jgi:mannose-6-phosphate isomerase-like protein (cupin superfamily)
MAADMAHVIDRTAWADDPALWKGEWQGGACGAGISVIFNYLPDAGGGPRLHRHPYPETFIVRSGVAVFTVAGETIRASAGQIVVVPAHTPHTFTNAGPGPLETVDIHANGEFITEWLE